MSTAEEVKYYTDKRINRILHQSDPKIRAELAALRRGVGKKPGELPDLWGEFLLDLPESLQAKTSEPSRAEYAIYTAVTLYALHQQGKDPKSSSMNGPVAFGTALKKWCQGDEDAEERMLKKLKALSASSTIEEASAHLRSLVHLLRDKDIPIDYPSLAKDLLVFQSPAYKDKVLLKWARDFYRYSSETATKEE
jgi:CRISPR system Cascade subunit CasB